MESNLGVAEMEDSDRFVIIESNHPTIKHQIWDYFENGVIAECDLKENADIVASALNLTTDVKWSTEKKAWVHKNGDFAG